MRGSILVYCVAFLAERALGKTCGALMITGQYDADNYSSCDTINGNVIISGEYYGDLTLNNVKEITGSLICTGASSLYAFEADSLETVRGDFTFTLAETLQFLDMPKLSSVGSLVLDTLPKLGSLMMATGISTIGEGSITNCGLTTLDGIIPDTIDYLTISGNTELKNASLSSLKQATGTMKISSNVEDFSLHLPSLVNGRDLFLSGIEEVYLDSLETLSGILILSGSALDTFAAPKLTSVDQDVKILDNANISSLDFSELTSVGNGLFITGDTNLSSVSFPMLQTVGGDVKLWGLESISLGKIEKINGFLSVTGPDIDCMRLEDTNYAKSTNNFQCQSTGDTTTSNTTTSNTTSTSTSSEASGGSGLSSGAKAGVGIGVSVGVLAILGLLFLYMRRRRQQKKGAEGVRSEDDKSESLFNELDGSGARLEAPGIKSEMIAELQAEDEAAELQSDKGQNIGKDRKIQNPAELE